MLTLNDRPPCSVCGCVSFKLRNVSVLYWPPRWELGSVYIRDLCPACVFDLDKIERVPKYIPEEQRKKYIRERIKQYGVLEANMEYY